MVDMKPSNAYDRITEGYRGLVKEHSMQIREHFDERLKAICLFGSIARVKEDSGNDRDVVVVAEFLEGLGDK